MSKCESYWSVESSGHSEQRFLRYQTNSDRIEFDDLTITFIVNEDLGNWIELKNWITSLAPYDSVSEENTEEK